MAPDAEVAGPESRALVVDDDETIRRLISTILGMNGYRSEQAANGEEALATLLAHPEHFCLLVTDIDMPGITGLQLAELVRQRFATLKILVVSGSALRPTPELLRKIGSIAFLKKPFATAQLLAAVRAILGDDPASAAAAPG